jgi:putative ABC transport system substrate-binding protein
LTEVLPGVSRISVLRDGGASASERARLDDAAQTLKVALHTLEVRTPEDFEPAVQAATDAGAEALFVTDASIFSQYLQRLMDLSVGSRLPATAGGGRNKEFAEAGALLTYAANFPSMHRTAADYVDKVLRGASPAAMPVEQPSRFDLRINVKTAGILGLTVPPSVLTRATEVIQ